MKQYLDQLRFILENGNKRDDRTGTGTIGVFGMQTRYDLTKGFPAITTKKLYWKGVVVELLWFLRGDTNIKYLIDNGVHIWDDDAYRFYLQVIKDERDIKPYSKKEFINLIKELGHPNNHPFPDGKYYHLGDLGAIYGAQWRKWKTPTSGLIDGHECHQIESGVDQITPLIDGIRENPYSRRHILNAWNVGELNNMALPPCHCMAQFYVNDDKLSCQVYVRSNDYGLGAPFNIASYALLTHMIAHVCGLGVQDLVYTVGDAHIYLDHIDQIKEQIARKPHDLSKLWLNPNIKDIDDFTYDDIGLTGYKCHPKIKMHLSVGK